MEQENEKHNRDDSHATKTQNHSHQEQPNGHYNHNETNHQGPENDANSKYGWGRLGAPACCARFNRIQWVLVFWCLASFSQSGYINGAINGSLTSLQQRYQLTSTQTGVLIAIYDAVLALVVLFVSYLGARGRRPRWIAFGCLLLGLSAILFASPHFIYSPYSYSSTSDSLCWAASANQTLGCGSSPRIGPYAILVVAQILAGLGGAPLYTLGYTYLHDNIKHGDSGLYIGVYMVMLIVGPAIGLVITSVCLNVYVDIPMAPSISTNSILWVGAWWLPFVCFGAFLIVLVFVPISGFPKELPATKQWNMHHRSHSAQSNEVTIDNIKTMVTKVLSSTTFIFVCIGTACQSFTTGIISSFGSKLLQDLFNMPAAKTSLLMGIILVPAAALGTFVGGVVIKRHKLTLLQMLHLMISVTAFTIPGALCLLFGCTSVPFSGILNTYPYSNATGSMAWSQPVALFGRVNLLSDCNRACQCSTVDYQPICGSDSFMYYSPCFAGCSSSIIDSSGTTVYYNCSCIQPPPPLLSGVVGSAYNLLTQSTSFATQSTCPGDSGALCKLPVFLVLLFIITFMSFSVTVPTIQVIIRSVPADCSSVALGMHSMCFRLLGIIPGPIVAGVIFDHNCYFWQKTGCFESASCLAYNKATTKMTLMFIIIGLHAGQVLMYVIARLLHPRMGVAISTSTVNTIVSASDRDSVQHSHM